MTDVATLLPSNASALERAAALSDARVSSTPVPLRDVWNAKACPPALLPWLAYAWRVEEWDDTWSIETKREVIAQTLPLKRIKATYGAVQGAVTAMGLPARVQEWFQQTPMGAPYTFRIRIEAEQIGFTAAQLAQVRRVIYHYKNTRSHLDAVDIFIRTSGGPRPASIALTGSETAVSDGTPRYSDGVTALDLMVDGAVNGYAKTGEATDELVAILNTMPAKLTIPTDL